MGSSSFQGDAALAVTAFRWVGWHSSSRVSRVTMTSNVLQASVTTHVFLLLEEAI